MNLGELIAQGHVWQAKSQDLEHRKISTGFPELNDLLNGGWPETGLCECLSQEQVGFSLLLPLLASLSEASDRHLLLINPPHIPYVKKLIHQGVNFSAC